MSPNRVLIAAGFLLACAAPSQEPKSSGRTIACKTPSNAASCYWTHGRLAMGNGNPSYRLWKIGTDRLLGIYSGPTAFNGRARSEYALDNEGPQLPTNVENALWKLVHGPWPNTVYADFEVCPLDKERPETMQAACIESAKYIAAKKSD